jgi:hypothetical protein
MPLPFKVSAGVRLPVQAIELLTFGHSQRAHQPEGGCPDTCELTVFAVFSRVHDTSPSLIRPDATIAPAQATGAIPWSRLLRAVPHGTGWPAVL